MRIILASQSQARARMLHSAGIEYVAVPADIDEEALAGKSFAEGCCVEETALFLAREKAEKISAQYPDALVIGSDQILVCEGVLFSKAPNAESAREKLRTLRGKTHALVSGVAVAQNARMIWQIKDHALLTMKHFDDMFLEHYCEKAGPALTKNVGAYALEGLGVRLFERIAGDYFTILGMPLLPLLRYLEQEQGLRL